jgi:hypothetical protein
MGLNRPVDAARRVFGTSTLVVCWLHFAVTCSNDEREIRRGPAVVPEDLSQIGIITDFGVLSTCPKVPVKQLPWNKTKGLYCLV